MPTLHLGEGLLAEIKALCQEAFPVEACGLLLGRIESRESGPELVAHAAHVARNTRKGSFTRFELAPEDFVDADSAARDAGLEIIGVYHSHPGAGAEPSAEDRAGAQQAWLSLIVAVEGSPGAAKATSVRCWELTPHGFEEQMISVSKG